MRFLLSVLLGFFSAFAQAETFIYDGAPSVAGEFPAMGWIGNCTGTAVGPKVILTAGHCVYTGKTITFEHRGSGQRYTASCIRHPEYNDRTVANDFALCILAKEFPLGTVYGNIAQDYPDLKEWVILNGLGRPNVRSHYWGWAQVSRYAGQDIITCGPSTLGSGDSGGALLAWTDDRTLKGGFLIYGVNSRGNNRCDWFNSLADGKFRSWAEQVELKSQIYICGVGGRC